MKKKSVFLILAIIWLIISSILLTLPGADIPKEDWFDKIGIDKWVHICMFALMAYLWCNGLAVKSSKGLLTICIACLLYGIGMEFIQKYCIPNRSFDISDMLADAVGAVLGTYISYKRSLKK